jgi:hypothetical protein
MPLALLYNQRINHHARVALSLLFLLLLLLPPHPVAKQQQQQQQFLFSFFPFVERVACVTGFFFFPTLATRTCVSGERQKKKEKKTR